MDNANEKNLRKELETLRKKNDELQQIHNECVNQFAIEESKFSEQYQRIQRAEAEIETREKLIQATTKITQMLLQEDDIDKAIMQTLEIIGQETGQDRAYVFEYHKDKHSGEKLMSQRYEWTHEGIKPEIDNPELQNLSFDKLFPRWFKVLASNDIIQGAVSDFPESEQQILKPQDIVSMLIVPIMIKESFWGFFGFDNCHEFYQWNTIEGNNLKTIASLIGMAIMKDRVQQELIKAKEINRLRLKLIDFSSEDNLDALLNKSIDEICDLMHSPIGFYHFIDVATQAVLLQEWSTKTKEKFCNATGKGMHYSMDKAGVWVDCVKVKAPVIHNNYKALTHKKGLPDGHVDIIRQLLIPVLRNNKVVAVLGLGNKNINYTDEDAKLATFFADLTWEIIEKKKADQALKESEKKFRNLFENTQEGLFQTTPDGKYVSANPSLAKMYGYNSPEELIKSRDNIAEQSYVDQADRALFLNLINKNGYVKGFEYQVKDKNGNKLWFYEDARAIKDSNGNTLFFEGFVIDITDRKIAEQKLKESTERNKAIIAALPDILMRMTRDLRIIDCETPDPSLLFLPIEQFLNKEIYTVLPFELAKLTEERINLTLTTREIQVYEYSAWNNNKMEWFESRMVPSGANEVMVIIRDITQRKQNDEALKESEMRFKAFMTHSPVFAYIKDQNLMPVYKNKPSSSVLNRSGLSDKLASHFFSDDVLNRLKQADTEILSGKKSVIELSFNAPVQGADSWIQEIKFPLTMPDGSLAVGGIALDITEQKLAEQRIIAQEAKQNAMIENISDVIAIIDQHLNIQYVSSNIKKWFGWSPSELVNGSALHIIDAEYLRLYKHEIENIIKKPGTFGEVEFEFICKDQTKRWVHLKANNQLNNPNIKGILVNFHDITERKKATGALKNAKVLAEKSERKVRSMFENSVTGYLYFTPEGKILEANPAILKLMGSPSLKASLEINLLTFPPLVQVGFATSVIKCLNEKKVISEKKLYQTKWGKTLYMQYFLVPLISNNQVEGIWANLNDLTDLWQTQQNLEHAKNKIEESELKYRLIAENTSDGILVLDKGVKITYASPSYLMMHGLPKNYNFNVGTEVIYAAIHPEDREDTFAKIYAAIKANKDNLIYTFRVKHTNGRYIWREDHARFDYDRQGNHVRTYVICRDITEKKAVEAELISSERKYRELADSLPVGVFEADCNGRLTFVNQFVFEKLGYTDDDFKNDFNILAFVGEGDREKAQESSIRIITESIPLSSDYNILKKNGETLPCIVASIPIIENDNVIGIRGTISDITERIKNEALIDEQLKKYNALLSTTSDGFFMIDKKGKFLDVNGNLCNMCGYSRSEILKLNLDDIEANENAKDIEVHIGKIKRAGFDIFESRIISKDGTIFDVEVSASYWYEKDWIFSFIRDISAKKIAAQQLIESEQRLQKAQAMAHVGNWELNLETKKMWGSKEALTIYGLQTNENTMQLDVINDAVLPTYREPLDKALNNLIVNNTPYIEEFKIARLNDGEVRDIRSLAELQLSANGKAEKVLGVIQDVTSQKVLENELRKLSNAIEQNPASIVITDANGTIEYVNPHFTKVTGYTFNEALGKNPRILKGNQNPPEFYQELWETITAGETWQGEFCNLKKNGELFWEMATISPVTDSLGNLTHFVAIKEDITEKKELDSNILKATIFGEENERNRFSRELHDGLGPLLSTIKLYFQWVAETTDENKKHILIKNGNENINNAIATLREISNNLSPRSLTTMGLVPSINNFIQHFKHPDIALITFSSNITDRFEKDHELALYRIALELINNGIKHGKPKNIKLTIDSNGNKDRIILTYTDNGKGFDYASAQKTVEGSGMYNIQNRVSSLKGSMQINTAAGKGVKVIIDIPLAFG